MYYLVYCTLYLISLLPEFILYGLSNVAAFILHNLVKYRLAVIKDGLKKALPHLEDSQLNELIKKFYRNFTGSFVETILLLSLSKNRFHKRATMDVAPLLESMSRGKRVIILASHLFGWEYGNSSIVEKIPVRFAGVFMTVQNKVFDRLMLKIRERFGALLVSVYNFPKQVHGLDEKKVVWGLMADQRPPTVSGAYWLNFFGRPAPFTAAPEKIAQRLDADVYFILPRKQKRGHYAFSCELVCKNAALTSRGEVTILYRDILEDAIRSQPADYLWSHKRWKRPFEKQFLRKWIDTAKPPQIPAT